MDIRIFNACLVLGWALVSAGAMLVHTGAGLIVSGGIGIGLTLFIASRAGVVKRG